MTAEKFDEIFEAQVSRCRAVLCNKAREYATEDRLHNFKIAALLQGAPATEALAGMMAKHTVSIYDMCRGGAYPAAVWDEKITDSINYLILLRALVEEGADEQTAI